MKKKIIAVAAAISLILTNIGTAAFAENYYENTSSVILAEASSKKNVVPDSAYDDSEYFFVGFTKDGSVKVFTYEDFEEFRSVLFYNTAATKEYYDEHYSDKMSFEEYKEYLKESFGATENRIKKYSKYKTIYFLSGYYDSGMKKADKIKAKKAVFEYVKKQVDSGKSKELSGLMKKSGQVVISADFEADGEFISISAEYFAGEKTGSFIGYKIISSNGKNVYTIDGNLVVSDTESIFISVWDEPQWEAFDGGDFSGYDTVIFDYRSTEKDEVNNCEIIDIKELAENLPGLKKLKLSNGITMKNVSYLSKFKNLKELSIDVSNCKSIDFLKKVKVDKLELRNINAPVKVISEFDAKEILIECDTFKCNFSQNIKDIYKLKKVTSLSVFEVGDDILDLSGIENMTGLKTLRIVFQNKLDNRIDLAPIGKIKNLKELELSYAFAKNISKIGDNKSIKKLTIDYMEENLSFISKMTGLEELTLICTYSEFFESLPYLKNCKHLTIDTIAKDDYTDYNNIFKMKNLRTLSIKNAEFSVKEISSLKNLESVSFTNCYCDDLSELRKCGRLKHLDIINYKDYITTNEFDADNLKGLKSLETLNIENTEIINYKSLKTLKGLKRMNLYSCNLSDEELKELKYYLPKCRIYTDVDKEVSADGYTSEKNK